MAPRGSPRSPQVTAVYRTPEERFRGLPRFDFEPHYRTVGDLRLAHLDVGEGPPVVMLHGAPSWSFIWRKVIPPVRHAGYRCIAPDHAGFGRSDKPVDPGWQSLERHVELTGTLLEQLDLRDVTLVLHDWGGPIGLTLALRQPDRVTRIVLLDTAIDPREAWMNDAWVRLREFVEQTEDLPVGELMRATCSHDPGDEVVAAYEAPFPVAESKAAVRGLALSGRDSRPMLVVWAESDLFLTLASGQRLASRIGRQIDHVIPDAGHGLLEDQGSVIGELIAEWLQGGR